MGAHEAADGVLTRMEADRLRARALELVAELDTIPLDTRQTWRGGQDQPP